MITRVGFDFTMAKTSKRKPITYQPAKAANNEIISRVHAENKKNSSAQALFDTGMIDAYQQASLYGNKHFDSSKWLIQNMGPMPKPLKLLDVGSLRLVYSKYSWIEATYIDLHSRHPQIQTADLLTFLPEDGKLFNIVCLSLVINFVGCPYQRFLMLRKARQLLDPNFKDGIVFIVLPRAVLFNSRRMTVDYFKSILSHTGLETIVEKHSKKLSMFITKSCPPILDSLPLKTPNLALSGANNFRISVLPVKE